MNATMLLLQASGVRPSVAYGSDELAVYGSIFSSIAHIASAAVKVVSMPLHVAQGALNVITHNPAWDILQTGASFIPGVGTAVSAGMSVAAAIGAGASLVDIALAAARGTLPGGPPVQAAFDVAVGLLLHGQRVDNTALNLARSHVPGGDLGKAAFDLAVSIILGKHVSIKNIAVQAGQKLIPAASPLLHSAYEAGVGMANKSGIKPAMVANVAKMFTDPKAKAMFQAGMMAAKPGQITASTVQTLKANAQHAPIVQHVVAKAHAVAKGTATMIKPLTHAKATAHAKQAHAVNAKALARPVLLKAMAIVTAAEMHNDAHAKALIASLAVQAKNHNMAAQHTLNLLAVARGALRRGVHV